jgi:uncharacterized protein (DUF2141 family)
MLIVLGMAAIPAPGRATDAARAPADLIIETSGLQSSAGHAIAKLFVAGDNVRQRGRQEVAATIRAGKATLVFAALPPGGYAVVVFHDVNDDGMIDHNLFGIPNEALAFSGGFRLSLTGGLPTFDKLRFTHGDGAQTLALRLR